MFQESRQIENRAQRLAMMPKVKNTVDLLKVDDDSNDSRKMASKFQMSDE